MEISAIPTAYNVFTSCSGMVANNNIPDIVQVKLVHEGILPGRFSIRTIGPLSAPIPPACHALVENRGILYIIPPVSMT
jgi:hypothetical protein